MAWPLGNQLKQNSINLAPTGQQRPWIIGCSGLSDGAYTGLIILSFYGNIKVTWILLPGVSLLTQVWIF